MSLIKKGLALSVLALSVNSAFASSHREAPGITETPKVDATDFYMFKSTEAGRSDFVTLIANYQPVQDTYGGPNYFTMDPDALYEIHIDNDGDGQENITYQFRFGSNNQKVAVPIRMRDNSSRSTEIPLRFAGQVAVGSEGAINQNEVYELKVAYGGRRTPAQAAMFQGSEVNLRTNALSKPVDNIGNKTIPDYNAYANSKIHTVQLPGCATPARVFVGQRSDPFYVDLGNTFDLVNFSAADITGANGETGGNNTLADKAVTSIALEVHQSCLTRGTDPVIGAWTTASLRQNRILDTQAQNINDNTREIGPWAQVSRLGMPLVNEVVIGLADKNRFNSSKPVNDATDAKFGSYVLYPSFPSLVEILFGVQQPLAPRNDLAAAFLTGIEGLNKPAGTVRLAEMLRLNTAIAPTPVATANPIGVIGGDAAGYPNGRRVFDDVVDITLRVAQGRLCTFNQPAVYGCVATDAPGGAIDYTDRVRVAPTSYRTTFPYMNTPIAGNVAQ